MVMSLAVVLVKKRSSQLSRGTAIHPVQRDRSQLSPMGSGHCCAVSTFLSGCGGLHLLACLTVFCCLLYVLGHTWPVQQLLCSSQHAVLAKMGRVQSLLHFTSQSERNQDSLPLQDDSILMTQHVTDVKVQTDGFRDVTLPGWPSFLNELKECL